ncbi:Phage antitermination protein Q [Plesiomonas shigelloides]|uniref:antiterminator Q family protein n=1 Tax=Plesiomonas shigelloides TaxID=703 RepID=UPI000E072FD4|nr:antiterminator Q family protein [Plesiomonas shigelloides]SUB63230.1 Phage antitermination protein Q [Plesiomonas shigelloides]
MDVGDTTLSQEQYRWVDDWLQQWGAWVYSGRLEKRMSSLIARLMEAADPTRVMPSRPMCNDDDGLLISQVVDRVLIDDEKALGILLSYYAFGSSKRAIACYQFSTAKPRKVMLGRGYEGWRKPSFRTCQRQVDQILDVSLCMIYHELYPAINERKRATKLKQCTKLCG